MEIHEKPFVEKYRPQVLDDVVGNEQMLRQLTVIAKDGNIPNIIVSGPPGVGKTTCVWCLARSMLGSYLKEAVLELNASDERGIDVVREKIKNFAQQKVAVPKGMHKLIILDEADSMTEAAQQALRMIMTEYSHTTRFALACNDSSKIIEPIQSRCAIMRFSRLSESEVLSQLLKVIEKEKIDYDQKGVEALVYLSDGDMRSALNNLQATAAGSGKVTHDNVFKVCDQPKPEVIREIVSKAQGGDFERAAKLAESLWSEGYNAFDIVAGFNKVIQSQDIPEDKKLKYLKELSLTKMRLVQGVATLLQLHGFLAKMYRLSQPG